MSILRAAVFSNIALVVVSLSTSKCFSGQVNMRAGFLNSAKPARVEKVVKVIKVVPEGHAQQSVQWILVDNRPSRGRRRQAAAGNRKKKVVKLSLPSNAIPGTEMVKMKFVINLLSWLRVLCRSVEVGMKSTCEQQNSESKS